MQSPYPSVFPDQLGAQPLSPAQQRYLHYISQEATRLAAFILDVQRQQRWSQEMLTLEPEVRCLISLIQLVQSEHDLLYQQWQLLSSSVSSTVES